MLEVGSLTDVITVTSPARNHPDRDGRPRRRADAPSRSTTSRSSAAARSSCCASCPASSPPTTTAFESVSFGGGANNTQGYTVNGIRSSGNTVSLDGSALIDIGSQQRRHRHAEQRHGAGGQGPELELRGRVRLGRHERQRGHQGRQLAVPAARSTTTTATTSSRPTTARTASPASTKPKSTFNYPGGNVGGPIIIPGWSSTRTATRRSSSSASKSQRQKVDPGSRFGVVPTLKQRSGDFSASSLTGNGAEPEPDRRRRATSRAGFPGAGTPAPGNNLAPYITPLGRVLANLYPAPNYVDPTNRYNYVFSRSSRPTAPTSRRGSTTTSRNNTKAYVRVAHESEDVESARGVWWGASESRCRRRTSARTRAGRYSGNVVTRAQPDDDQRSAGQLQPPDAGQHLQGSVEDDAWSSYGLSTAEGPFAGASPYIPGVIPNWGGGVSNMWAPANDMFAHNDELHVLGQAHEDRRRARPEVRRLGRAAAEAAELPEQRGGAADLRRPGWTPGSTGNASATS